MTYQQIAEMIGKFGLPFAYYQFEEGSGQQCPFVVFYYPSQNNFRADNKNYAKIVNLTIELYTDNKDFVSEEVIEDVLDEYELAYDKDETYIESEKMYEVIYTMEVYLNAEQ